MNYALWSVLIGLGILRLLAFVVATPEASLAAQLASTLWPFLPALAGVLLGLRGPWVYALISAWLCFIHGAMWAVADAELRLWGLGELILALLFFALMWRRMRLQKSAQAAG